MGNKARKDRKMMKEVEQYEAIKRQQLRKKQPYKSLIYSGKKALGAGRENKSMQISFRECSGSILISSQNTKHTPS